MKTLQNTLLNFLSAAQPAKLRNWRRQRGEIAHYQKEAAASRMRLTTSGGKLRLQNANKVITIARHNYPYLFDLIGNFDYYFDAVIPAKIKGLLMQDFSSQALHKQREDGVAFWFPSLPEPMATTRIYLSEAKLSAGETVFDLGAYAGGASYYFSQAVGQGGHVYAFEPDRVSYECLEANIQMHGLSNVSPFRLGIWSSSGMVTFQSEGSLGSAVREAADRINANIATIDTTSLGDFCSSRMIKKVDFVKMDIEGSEVAVLESSGEFIDAFKPRFVVEIHRLGLGLTEERVIAALLRHGYSVRLIPQADLSLPLLYSEPAGS